VRPIHAPRAASVAANPLERRKAPYSTGI